MARSSQAPSRGSDGQPRRFSWPARARRFLRSLRKNEKRTINTPADADSFLHRHAERIFAVYFLLKHSRGPCECSVCVALGELKDLHDELDAFLDEIARDESSERPDERCCRCGYFRRSHPTNLCSNFGEPSRNAAGRTPAEERASRIAAGRCPDCGADTGHYRGCVKKP